MTGASATREPLLDVRDLKTYFFTRSGVVKAVDGVSFTLHSGETLGIVGESGCGKSVTALSIMRLVPEPAGRIVGGHVLLAGEDLLSKTKEEMQQLRGREICMILQDPMTSLNPAFSIGDQLLETLQLHRDAQPTGLRARAVDLLQRLKIPSPQSRLHSYPHQLSGGMRQRVVAAIALAGAPRVLIADEATTALDATIQYQYLLLLKDLQRQTGLSMIFITHDFGIVAKVCDRVVVMYAGRVVESATVRDLFNHPSHPYTEALMRSVPDVDTEVDFLPSIEGQPPALDNLPPGCPFAPRCSYVMDRCLVNYPPSVAVSSEHQVACWKHA